MESCLKMERNINIRAPWGNIAGLTWGEETESPVFLCPGRMQHSAVYRPLVARLPTGFFYVAIDLPGNGYSDHFPKGLQLTTYDLVPAVVVVQEYYKWNTFVFIGHSLGCSIGRHYDMAYPGRLSLLIEVDPTPAYLTVTPGLMEPWYKEAYGDVYSARGYAVHTGDKSTAPLYTYQQAKDKLIKAQDLTDAAADLHLKRFLEPAGDDLYRFTYDQRMKSLFVLPFTPEDLKVMYTASTVPTLCILATESIYRGAFRLVPFVMDENAWPNKNYKFKVVNGNHDVLSNDPGCMSEFVSKFLTHRLNCKL